MKRKSILRNGCKADILPGHDKSLLDGISNIAPNYRHTSTDGVFDLDYMLYRHVKEMVCNHTTYFLCTKDLIFKENEKGLSASTEKIYRCDGD